ncbi:MAG: glycosyltransferase family 2 protein [Clostridia bacterium]|nr:glycosyltransferase family 2 protein [Clostridia bacterium]
MNYERYKVSIIVPIYNVAKYLSDTISSVINQTYKNLQIILVDDGSTDSSNKICDEYAKQDDRIIVIHKSNGGLSDARNAGIKVADGDFIFYLDGDDYLVENGIETYIVAAESNNSALVISSFYYTYADREDVLTLKFNDIENLSNYSAMESLVKGEIQNFAWGKLIRADIAKKHFFPLKKLFEDNYWAHYVIDDAKKITIINKPLVHYRQRDNSISYTYNIKRLEILDGWKERKKFLDDYYPKLLDIYLENIAKSYVGIAWLIFKNLKRDRKRAFDKMRMFNKSVKLQNYSAGATKKLIEKLDKSNLSYYISAMIYKILGR